MEAFFSLQSNGFRERSDSTRMPFECVHFFPVQQLAAAVATATAAATAVTLSLNFYRSELRLLVLVIIYITLCVS